MPKNFYCDECTATFNYPVIRFDSDEKVCPACLSKLTEDAWELYLQKTNWYKRQKAVYPNPEELLPLIFPVHTKTSFENELEG